MVHKSQGLLTAREGEKAPVHRSNQGRSFTNVVIYKNGERGADKEGNTQASDVCK